MLDTSQLSSGTCEIDSHLPKEIISFTSAEGTYGYLWCLFAYQNPCWLPGSLSITGACQHPGASLSSYTCLFIIYRTCSPYTLPITLSQFLSLTFSLSLPIFLYFAIFSLNMLSSLSFVIFLFPFFPPSQLWPCPICFLFSFGLFQTPLNILPGYFIHNKILPQLMKRSCCQFLHCAPLNTWKISLLKV